MKDENVKEGFFKRLYNGLSKTRKNLSDKLEQLITSNKELDDEFYEELEMILISADIGVQTAELILDRLKKTVKEEKAKTSEQARELLCGVITEILSGGDGTEFELKTPAVIIVVGVNGVGKTTAIGKLAHMFRNEGKSVLLAAGDTFRAAAVEQLCVWAERSGINCIKHAEGADAAAVIFDAVTAAKARKTDVLICDTAGRLHNKKNLMEELRKINNIIVREYPEADRHVLLALDATTGQNAVNQAKAFSEVADINGIILNKLDGTAKGGVVISICSEMNIPVRYIGIGEQIDDIQLFNARDFVQALIGG